MSRFYRLTTDQQLSESFWENSCVGPRASSCWLIGGGPSLERLPCAEIARSAIPRMTVNLAGTKLIRPNFWTAYDPSVRFHRSVYLDAGITKFLPRCRAMDLVPETTYKVCECPQTYFFDRDPQRDYTNFLSAHALGIVDWADTFVQAIDILYRLGFRRIYLAGCEMSASPSSDWIHRAAELGVTYLEGEPLADFVRRCRAEHLTDAEMEHYGFGPLYHFDETKSFESVLRTDEHYFRVVQSLRLSRQAMVSAGVELISVTPRSRLNAFFEYRAVESVLDQIRVDVGDPQREPTRGLYTQPADRRKSGRAFMRDILPPRLNEARTPGARAKKPVIPVVAGEPELLVEHEDWEPFATATGEFSQHFLEPREVH